VYTRFHLMRGLISPAAYEEEIDLVKTHIKTLSGEHWSQFLESWS